MRAIPPGPARSNHPWGGSVIRSMIGEVREDLHLRIAALDREVVEHARADEMSRRLMSIPGIGTMTVTDRRAGAAEGSPFTRARDRAAWRGLVPRQHATGGTPKLAGISRRGNSYLRGLFIHRARATLPLIAKAEDATGQWLRGLLARAHYNAVVVAFAAQFARIARATLRKGVRFERQPEPAHA